jgi:hypothetical protein
VTSQNGWKDDALLNGLNAVAKLGVSVVAA